MAITSYGTFLIGPAAGFILVQCIFGLPSILWWFAGEMGVFMLLILLILVLKERALIIEQTK